LTKKEIEPEGSPFFFFVCSIRYYREGTTKERKRRFNSARQKRGKKKIEMADSLEKYTRDTHRHENKTTHGEEEYIAERKTKKKINPPLPLSARSVA